MSDEERAAELRPQFEALTGPIDSLVDVIPRGGLSQPTYQGRVKNWLVGGDDTLQALVLDVAYRNTICTLTLNWEAIEGVYVLAGPGEAWKEW